MKTLDIIAVAIGVIALASLLSGKPERDPFAREAAVHEGPLAGVRFLSRPYDDRD